MKEEKLPPLKYRSDDGFTILCGRNNLQNDRLTLKDSRNGDLWLHTQKIPGSHVVVVTEGKTPPDRTIEQAAVIAACNSKARESGKVAVDYTEIRNVRKHPGGQAGTRALRALPDCRGRARPRAGGAAFAGPVKDDKKRTGGCLSVFHTQKGKLTSWSSRTLRSSF